MSSARVLPASLMARASVASGLRRGVQRARGVARARPPTVPSVHASICGIDLGTTNSCVAVVIDGRPVLVPDEKGRRTIPSVVHFAVDGSVAVGRVAAKRLTRTIARLTLRRGVHGFDVNKAGTRAGDVRVPEATGLAPGCVYLVAVTFTQCLHLFLGGAEAASWASQNAHLSRPGAIMPLASAFAARPLPASSPSHKVPDLSRLKKPVLSSLQSPNL